MRKEIAALEPKYPEKKDIKPDIAFGLCLDDLMKIDAFKELMGDDVCPSVGFSAFPLLLVECKVKNKDWQDT
jgi:hypothetical protein